MNHEETICYKVDRVMEELERAVKTRNIDVPKVANLMHEIRRDAQRMEDGLHRRKASMEKAGIEAAYQKLPKEKPDKRNKIQEMAGKRKKVSLEFIVKEEGKEIYHRHNAHAGLVCMVERVNDIDDHGIMNGTSQVLFFGHDLAVWFAFDQIRQKMESKRMDIMTALQTAVDGKLLKDRGFKLELLSKVNNHE